MASLLKRIRNLWEMSAYKVSPNSNGLVNEKVLVKEIPTIEKKLAIIIQEKADIFKEFEEKEI